MRNLRGFSGLLALVLSGALVGCTQGEPKPNLSTASPAATTASSTSVSPPSTVVPVNKIPPGNPATWVPSGVPTTAPYKEPGDVVPMFTQAMFLNNSTGALDAAKYYLDSINWSFALVESRPFTVICDAPTCKRQASVFAEDKRAGRHTIGGRVTEGPPRLIPAPARSGAQWVAQVEVMFAAGHSVDRQGKTVQSYPKGTDRTNLYMKWNGVMWRVAEHALTS